MAKSRTSRIILSKTVDYKFWGTRDFGSASAKRVVIRADELTNVAHFALRSLKRRWPENVDPLADHCTV
ncbi:hypothetical protein NK8_83230 (plasmid) [Caballeronia sp. NK8]|nr:hypothetical protein NK8_83230 [Caballeronia sp. NK8]